MRGDVPDGALRIAWRISSKGPKLFSRFDYKPNPLWPGVALVASHGGRGRVRLSIGRMDFAEVGAPLRAI